MKKNLLAGMIAALFATGASAFEPFTVMDIRVDGIQRTEAGTVFSYLPIKVGDVMNDDKAAQAIKALFATGFFKDVRVEVDKDVIVVVLDEQDGNGPPTATISPPDEESGGSTGEKS